MRDVLDAYAFFESGQLAEFWGADPPNILVEAVHAYHAAIRAIRAHDDDEAAKKRKREAEAARARR